MTKLLLWKNSVFLVLFPATSLFYPNSNDEVDSYFLSIIPGEPRCSSYLKFLLCFFLTAEPDFLWFSLLYVPLSPSKWDIFLFTRLSLRKWAFCPLFCRRITHSHFSPVLWEKTTLSLPPLCQVFLCFSLFPLPTNHSFPLHLAVFLSLFSRWKRGQIDFEIWPELRPAVSR